MEHECIHEKDFGILFTKIDMMSKAFDSQNITMSALKTAIDASLKYQISMEAISGLRQREQMPQLQKTAIIVSAIIGFSIIATSLIIKFAG